MNKIIFTYLLFGLFLAGFPSTVFTQEKKDSRVITKTRKDSIGLVSCPFDIRLLNAKEVEDGDLATFEAVNVKNIRKKTPKLKFEWKVLPNSAQFKLGKKKSTLVLDSTGFGGKELEVTVDVTDGVTDASCRQRIIKTLRVKKVELRKVEGDPFDEFETTSDENDKARLDNLALELRNNPTVSAYVIIYEGTDSIGKKRTPDYLSKRAWNQVVKIRGSDENRIQVVTAKSDRKTSTFQLWLVPPGAKLPAIENPIVFDEFSSVSDDRDKKRLDLLAKHLNASSQYKAFIVVHKNGSGKSKRSVTAILKNSLKYLVETHNLSPDRLEFKAYVSCKVSGTKIQIYLVP